MAASNVTYSETFRVPRASLAGVNAILASIDFGCSLIKAVFVPKEEELDEANDHVNLHCLTFRPSELDGALQIVKSRVHLNKQSAALRLTGVGCTRFKEKIESELGCKTDFVQEILAAARGMYFLGNHCSHEAICHPDPEPPSGAATTTYPELIEQMMASMRLKLTKNNPPPGSPFPAIMFNVGSGAIICFIDAEGRSKMLTGVPVAGRSFLGLARLLLGTSDYSEIVALAEKGDARKTGLLVRHMIEEDPASPYGFHDPESVMQPFGHVPNDDKGLESYSKEDLAAGLVHMLCSIFYFCGISAAESTGVSRFYVSGNWTRAETMRSVWFNSYRFMFAGGLDFNFVKTGHVGAVGAMITDPADSAKYMLM